MDDLIGGGLAFIVVFVEGMTALILLTAELVALVAELLFWALRYLFGRRNERPQRRQFGRRKEMRNSRAPLISLIILFVAGLLAFLGVKLYEDVLTVRVQTKSSTGWPVGAVEIEWIEAEGAQRAGKIESGGSRYWKWGWDQLRITDKRFESEIVDLTKQNQVIVLKPTPMEELKQKAALMAVDTGIKAVSHLLFNKENPKEEN